MTILERLLRGATPAPRRTERSEGALRARLAEIQAGIAEGQGDVFALLEEREDVQRSIEAARIAADKTARDKHQAALASRRAQLEAEIGTELATVWRTLPELRVALIGLQLLEGRIEGMGNDFWQRHTGLPLGAAAQLSQAFRLELFGTRLIEEWHTPGAVSTPIIEPPRERVATTAGIIERTPTRYI